MIVDLLGWYDSFGDVVIPTPHTRLMDTKNGINGSTKIGAGETRTVTLAGLTGVSPLIPSNATGVVLKIVAVDPSASSYLRVTHSGSSGTSNMNVVAGVTRSNSVTVPLNAGTIKIYNNAGSTNLIIDVMGYTYND